MFNPPSPEARAVHAMYKTFRAYCLLKYHLYLEKPTAFRDSFVLLNISEKKGLSQNIAAKLAAKRRKLKVLKSLSETLLNSPNFCMCPN